MPQVFQLLVFLDQNNEAENNQYNQFEVIFLMIYQLIAQYFFYLI